MTGSQVTAFGIGLMIGGVIVGGMDGYLPPATIGMMAIGAVLAIVGAIRL